MPDKENRIITHANDSLTTAHVRGVGNDGASSSSGLSKPLPRPLLRPQVRRQHRGE